MSFPNFFSGPAVDAGDDEQFPSQEGYHTYAPRPIRSHSSHAALENVLTENSDTVYSSRPSPAWSSSNINYSGHNPYFQGNSGPPYYQIPSSFNPSGGYVESSSNPAYMLPTDQSCGHTSERYPSSSFIQYPASFVDSGAPSNDLQYPSADVYHPPGMVAHAHLTPRPDHDIKEEPQTPSSPQFIFEFPGGEDELPPFEDFAIGSGSASATFYDQNQATPTSAPVESPTPTRSGSPTTEAMKSMMSVFRVDPFASYDADSGTRRKRRKRGSTYAQSSDPEANSREEPLMFTFQLDISPLEMDDNAEDEWRLDHYSSAGGDVDHRTTFHEMGDFYQSESQGGVDYEALAPEVNPGSYRPQHGSLATDGGIMSRPSGGGGIELSMQVHEGGDSGGANMYSQEHSQNPAKLVPGLFPLYVSDPGPYLSSTSPQDKNIPHAYPSLSRYSSPSCADSEMNGEQIDPLIHPRTISVEGSTAPSHRRSRSRPPIKMHVCWICHKEFPRPSGLATHMNTHSGLKPYKCPMPDCSKTFAVRSNARRHMRIHGALAELLTPNGSDASFEEHSPDSLERERVLGADVSTLSDSQPRLPGADLEAPSDQESERDIVCPLDTTSPSSDSVFSMASPNSIPGNFPPPVLGVARDHGVFDDGGGRPFTFDTELPSLGNLGEATKPVDQSTRRANGLHFPFHTIQPYRDLPVASDQVSLVTQS